MAASSKSCVWLAKTFKIFSSETTSPGNFIISLGGEV
jgi:hypothetical protein